MSKTKTALKLGISKKDVNKTMVVNLPITNLMFGNYQKKLNKSLVRKIVEFFDINRMRPIEASYRDGFYWVFDGQHRLHAYIEMGIEEIPCQIHYGLTYEDEARLFAKQQENVGRITVTHKWNALVEAKDPVTLKSIEIANKFGYTIQPESGGIVNNIIAVKAIMDIVQELQFVGLYDIFTVTSKCWSNQLEATQGNVLQGLKTFFILYGKDKNFDIKTLIKKIGKIEASKILQKSTVHSYAKSKAIQIAIVLRDMYNERLRKERKLEYKFS